MSYSRVFRRRLWMMDSADAAEENGSEMSVWRWIQMKYRCHIPPFFQTTNLRKMVSPQRLSLNAAGLVLDVYLYARSWAHRWGQGLYTRYRSVQWVTKHSYGLYRWWRNIPSEPETTPWLHVAQLVYDKNISLRDTPGNLSEPSLKEEYVMCPECTLPENVKNRWELMTQQQRRKYDDLLEETGTLWMYKESDIYHIRIGYREPLNLQYMKTTMRSTVRFISVEYTHPSMKHTIPLEIPVNMMYVGNCLFSPAFVARMLRYKSCDMYGGNHQSYVFDLNYTLNIMDNQLKYLELSSTQYLRLTPTGGDGYEKLDIWISEDL